jgi:hypothetical protein
MTTLAFEMVDSAQVKPVRKPRKTTAAKAAPKPKPPTAASDTKYVARKSMQIGSRKIKPGDLVPEAGSWPRVESWVRAGYLDIKE